MESADHSVMTGRRVLWWMAIMPSPQNEQFSIVVLVQTKQITVSRCENRGNMTLQSLALFYLPVMEGIAEKVSEIVCRYLGGRVKKGY